LHHHQNGNLYLLIPTERRSKAARNITHLISHLVWPHFIWTECFVWSHSQPRWTGSLHSFSAD